MANPETDEEDVRALTGTGRAALLAVLILVAGAAGMAVATKFGKKASEVTVKRPVPDVELVTAAVSDVPLVLESQGVIQAVTETRAAAEIAGRILWVSPQWDTGGEFKTGDELLRIDDADYKAALAAAEASAAEAALAVRMEEERAAQAVRDWNKLASGKPESDLVTRGPQLAAAKARHTAALGAAEKARRDVERTVLRAPYDGRIRATLTDIGSWVAPGAPLAEFYATSEWQVRLPLSLEDYALLDQTPGAGITLRAEGMDPVSAALVRTAGEIDRAARTIHVIAGIKAGAKPLPALLQAGLYVRAELPGTTLKNVVKLPRECLLPGHRAAIITAENKLSLREVTVARSTKDDVFLSSGIAAGDRVLATVLAVTTEAMQVNPLTPAAPSEPAPVPAEAGKPAGKTS
jgi:RND family efflux transporter MFP subunit